MKTIGDRIKEARGANNMTQEALATKAGVSQGLIGQIEAGINKGTKHINAIANALGVATNWLEYGAEQMQPPHSAAILHTTNWPFINIDPVRFSRLPKADIDRIESTVEDMLAAAEMRRMKNG